MPTRFGPRHRSRILSAPQFESTFKTTAADPGNPVLLTETLMSQSTDAMDDVVTRDYHKTIAAGGIVNNPCLYQEFTTNNTGSGYLHFDGGGGDPNNWTHYDGGCITSLISGGFGDPDNVLSDSKAPRHSRVRALSQMDRTPYAFGEDLLELRETIRFLKSPIKSISNLVEVIRSTAVTRSRVDGVSLLSAIADVYSTERFALEPLVRSALDALAAYSDKPKTRPSRQTARGFATDKDEYSETDAYYTGVVRYDVARVHSFEDEAHSQILYEISNPIDDLRFRLGFRTKDWPLTLWQVFPLSFMVDRMVNISTAVQAAVNLADPNLKILSASTRVKRLRLDQYEMIGGEHPTYDSVTAQGGLESKTSFTYDRVPWEPSVSDIAPPVHLEGIVKDAQSIADLIAISINRLIKG